MDWIKKNYEKLVLLIFALVLLAMSAMLILDAMHFEETFAGIKGQVAARHDVPPPDTAPLDRAAAALQKPAQWSSEHKGSIFISEPYLLQGNPPELVDPFAAGSKPLHEPVPNEWFTKNGLDILDPNILNEDPDGDGFTNLDEWRGIKGDGSDATDPNNKASHPPFWTKLRLLRSAIVHFRLVFPSYDGDPNKPDTLSFQINTIDVRQPSQFGLKVGDAVAGTKFKITKFRFKKETNASTGEEQDVSELTLQNTENHDELVMPLEKTVDYPDIYALFHYLIDGKDYRAKKGSTFSLPPDNQTYKLIDTTNTEALIETPDGQRVKVTQNGATLAGK